MKRPSRVTNILGLPRARRRGTTILEMLMLMSIVSVVLGACAIQIQLLMKLEQSVRQRIEESNCLERLAERLRADVHNAASADFFNDKQGSGVRVHGNPDESFDQLEYRREPNRIVRIAKKQGKPTARELFATPRSTGADFEVRRENSRQFVVLTLKRKIGSTADAPTSIHEIVAIVGPASGPANRTLAVERRTP